MNFPIVREYRNDILNQNPENRILGEPFSVPKGTGGRIFIPTHAPFFVKSLRLYNANMEPLTKVNEDGVGDWRLYKQMGGLTELTAKSVGCMIEVLNPNVTLGYVDYDTVGHFSLFDNSLLRLILETAQDDRPVYWDNLHNKPVVFPPELHGMSLIYEIIAFGDMVELISMIIAYLTDNAKSVVEIKIEHYLDLLNHYINVYRTELLAALHRHEGSYDSHGLTKTQVGLPLVDNFPTARGDDLLKPNSNMHVTVGGMKTIIDSLSFNAAELMTVNKVAISQFGNANFIPPSLDGSFEGIGSISESAAICRESDGTVSFLSNRLDGRVSGLYFSLMEIPSNPGLSTLTYTGFKYVHPKFVPDGSVPNLVAPGSGGEVILVGDSIKQLFYIGVTNGSLDPSKHVYSKIDLSPIRDAVLPAGVRLSALFPYLSIALIGDWIYLFQGCRSPTNADSNVGSNMGYRMVYRVALADVKATINVTPVRQLVNFTDADGVTVTNSPFYRWFSTEQTNGLYTKMLYTFTPPGALINSNIGGYSLHTLVAANPNKPGKYALKFLAGAYSSGSANGIASSFNTPIEINYEFDPVTNTFVLMSKTETPPVNWANSPIFPPDKVANPNTSYGVVFSFNGQGYAVMDDGLLIGSGGYNSFSGFPRAGVAQKLNNSISKYDSVSRFFNWWNDFAYSTAPAEKVVSPLASSGYVRALQYYPDGEMYNAGDKTDLARCKIFWRNVTGRFAQRPNVTNLFISNIYSRPLTNDVREVNAPPGLGAAVVCVPTAQLANYGIDAGDSMLCMGSQKKYLNRNDYPGQWTTPVEDDDILLIDSFTRSIRSDGLLDIVPTKETIYPSAIVEQLKAQVENPDIMAASPEVIVTVTDPSASTLMRFVKLPILATVTHRGPRGQSNSQTAYMTVMSIAPVYTTDANGRRSVTSFTVINKMHYTGIQMATTNLRTFGGRRLALEAAATNFTGMRTYYYVNGNNITIRLENGTMLQSTGDANGIDWLISVNNPASGNWVSCVVSGKSSAVPNTTITPDNGISPILNWANVSGGAATIQGGPNINALVGSVYPEVGWVIFAQSEINVAFNGRPYKMPPGIIDLRDVSPNPSNKTFYIYIVLVNGIPVYQVTDEKRLETAFQLWVAKVITGATQIISIERYNVFAMNGSRVSEIKRGNCIPASSGLANEEGQLPWLRSDEILP